MKSWRILAIIPLLVLLGACGFRPLYGTDGVLEMTTGYLPSVKYLPDPSWSSGQTGAKWLAEKLGG